MLNSTERSGWMKMSPISFFSLSRLNGMPNHYWSHYNVFSGRRVFSTVLRNGNMFVLWFSPIRHKGPPFFLPKNRNYRTLGNLVPALAATLGSSGGEPCKSSSVLCSMFALENRCVYTLLPSGVQEPGSPEQQSFTATAMITGRLAFAAATYSLQVILFFESAASCWFNYVMVKSSSRICKVILWKDENRQLLPLPPGKTSWVPEANGYAHWEANGSRRIFLSLANLSIPRPRPWYCIVSKDKTYGNGKMEL